MTRYRLHPNQDRLHEFGDPQVHLADGSYRSAIGAELHVRNDAWVGSHQVGDDPAQLAALRKGYLRVRLPGSSLPTEYPIGGKPSENYPVAASVSFPEDKKPGEGFLTRWAGALGGVRID